MSQTQKKLSFVNTLLLIWCILCVVVYSFFSARRSYIQSVDIFSPAAKTNEILTPLFSITYWWDVIFSLLGVFIFTSACISLGKFIFSITNQKYQNSITVVATWLLIGNATYSIIFLSLAGIGKLNPIFVLSCLVIGILINFNKNIKEFNNLNWSYKPSDKQELILLGLNVSLLILALLNTSARISYDSTAIYFSNAKITAYLQNVEYFQEETFVASAFQNAIQFTAIMQLFGEQSARMFSWICGLVIIVFVVALAKNIGVSQKARMILVTLLLSSTAFIDLLGDGKVDLINSAYSIASIYWIVTQSQNKYKFVLIGLLAGMSIIGRPNNAFLFTVFAILYYSQKTILETRLKQSKFIEFIMSFVWIAFGAIPLGIYHLFANWLVQGSPFAFLSTLSSINPSTGPWDNKPEAMLALRLLYPLVATFRNTPQSLGNISPLVVGFVPFILLPAIRKKINFSQEAKTLTISSIVTLWLWVFLFFTVVELRYVFFLWFIILIPVAQIISTVLEYEDRFFSFIKQAVIFALLIFMIFRTLLISTVTYSPLDQNKNPQCKDYILCEYLTSINESALPNERVLSLSAYRYYLRNDLFICSSKHSEYSLLKKSAQQNANAFWEEVIRQGYTYIAYEFDYTTRHLQLGLIPNLENTPEWIKLERIDNVNSDAVAAYKIHTINPPIESQFTCVENDQNLLEVQLLP